MNGLVRLLLISALAAALVGCSSASRQTQRGFEYADRGLYQTHYEQSSQVHSKRRVLHGPTITAKKTNARHRKNNNSTKIAEPHLVPKMGAPPFTPLGDKSDAVTTTPSSATKTDHPQSSQLDDEAKKMEIPSSSQLNDDSVIKKAKATIAAKMGDPNSVEFEGWERAARKNALGNSIDTICGFVRDKNSGPKPFLYLVPKDEVYIGGYTIATSEYRNICSITMLPGR
jgi:hypothetical protein